MPNEFLIARHYVAEGLAQYELDICKRNASVCLFIGDLNGAMVNTRIALFITRLLKVSA